jgi:hypothetical protein
MTPRADQAFLAAYERRMLTIFTHEPTGRRVSYRAGLGLARWPAPALIPADRIARFDGNEPAASSRSWQGDAPPNRLRHRRRPPPYILRPLNVPASTELTSTASCPYGSNSRASHHPHAVTGANVANSMIVLRYGL